MNAKDSRGQAACPHCSLSHRAARRDRDVSRRRQLVQGEAAAPGDRRRGRARRRAGASARHRRPATALAIQYAADNGDTLDASGISFSSDMTTDDTISVQMSAPAPGFFSKLFGIGSVTVGAHAAARTDNIDEARFAAPIGVNFSSPGSLRPGCPCFDQQTTLTLGKIGPGGFDLINIDGSRGGTNPNTLADWMLHGLDAWMPLGNYYSDPGAKFNDSGMQAALQRQHRQGAPLPRLRHHPRERSEPPLPRDRLGRLRPDRLRRHAATTGTHRRLLHGRDLGRPPGQTGDHRPPTSATDSVQLVN